MTQEMLGKLQLFAANTQAVKKNFPGHHAMTKRWVALVYTQENREVDCEALQRCRALIKSCTGVFSAFRGYMSLAVAGLLSLSADPERLLRETLKVYDMLKGAKLRASEYLALAALQIAAGTGPGNFAAVVWRTRAFYEGMKACHWFYTGRDDYIFAAMLGLSQTDVAFGTTRIKQIYTQLKNGFWDRNSVQALAQILVLGGISGTEVQRVLALRQAFRERKLRLDRSCTLPFLGVLALLPADVGIIVQRVDEAQVFLRSQRGFSALTVSKQELLLLAAAIVAGDYVDHVRDGVLKATLSTSVTSLIIAQQTAVVAAISASGTAAASSG